MNKELIAASPGRPIRSKEQDLLGRSAFVDRLCNALINPDTKQSTGVTIGVTGEWGSGKSSILNLLHERVEERYKNAIVIRFDPWLVSNRDDLIRQFFAEFVGTINKEPSIKKRMAKLTEKLVDYAAHLSPAADLYTPGLGAIVGGGLRTTKQIIRRDTSLHTQRIEMVETLDQLTTPIVVIIDELDRIEDDEVHAVAQLVRSVADFPPLSYILAYDVNRVIQALGSGMNKEERNRRGQDYLEKIIQFQIPLPVTLQGELYDLLRAELIEVKADTILSDSWETTERFKELIDIILVPGLISTPRDVKRLIGTYHVVGAMVRGEVEWVDLLAFCVLLVKAPWIIYRLRKEPDYAVENPLSNRILERRLDDQQSNTVERLGIFLPDVATLDEIGPIMRFLFPWFANQRADEHRHPDSLCYRRPLLTVLRWNLLPSTHSRSEIIEFLSLTRRDILEKLTALDGR